MSESLFFENSWHKFPKKTYWRKIGHQKSPPTSIPPSRSGSTWYSQRELSVNPEILVSGLRNFWTRAGAKWQTWQRLKKIALKITDSRKGHVLPFLGRNFQDLNQECCVSSCLPTKNCFQTASKPWVPLVEAEEKQAMKQRCKNPHRNL